MKLPTVIYVYVDGEGTDAYFVATEALGDLDEGLVGVYDLRERLNVRHALEVKRPGTTTWFKPDK